MAHGQLQRLRHPRRCAIGSGSSAPTIRSVAARAAGRGPMFADAPPAAPASLSADALPAAGAQLQQQVEQLRAAVGQQLESPLQLELALPDEQAVKVGAARLW